MAQINQKEYLKKYLSGKKDGKKKKRKKKPATSDRVKIIDDDIDISHLTSIEDAVDLLVTNEDAPQIVGVIDERPMHLRIDDYRKSDLWKPLGAQDYPLNDRIIGSKRQINDDDSNPTRIKLQIGSSSKRPSEKSKSPPRHKKLESTSTRKVRREGKSRWDDEKRERIRSDDDCSPASQYSDHSPQRKKQREDRESPTNSPPRRTKIEHLSRKGSSKTKGDSDSSPTRPTHNRSDDDNSPVRKANRESDSSPPRKRSLNGTPPRRNKTGDYSPPRRNRRDDNSPPRRNKRGDDSSSPRNRRNSDSSPPRYRSKRRDDSSPPRRNKRDDTSSPSRKRRDSDDSPPIQRSKRDNDNSPPRRSRRNSDSSPPRRKLDKRDDNDNSPPRRFKKDLDDKSPGPSFKAPDEPKRRLLPGDKKGKYLIPAKRAKTLDGKTAGLQSAQELVQENEAYRKREDDLFKTMSSEVSGANASAILRDRKTGKIRDLQQEAEERREKEKREEENKEKYSRWGRGLKQVEDYEGKLAQDLHEMNKPLARYADDEDLEKYLKEQEREGDPMLAYIRKKKKKKVVESGKPLKPQYEGEFMPNRFGVVPGHRWDGVDRSNGYEKKWFEVQNAKRAQQEEIYKWSTEDM